MTTVYKFTDSRGRTMAKSSCETQWGPGLIHTATGPVNQPLCTDGWIHFYWDPLVAVFLDAAHGGYLVDSKAQLWTAWTDGETLDDCGLKGGARALTTLRRIPYQLPTMNQRIAFTCLCIKQADVFSIWHPWIDEWLANPRTVPAIKEPWIEQDWDTCSKYWGCSKARQHTVIRAARFVWALKPLDLPALAKQAFEMKLPE